MGLSNFFEAIKLLLSSNTATPNSRRRTEQLLAIIQFIPCIKLLKKVAL
jgi:hypothetical protein